MGQIWKHNPYKMEENPWKFMKIHRRIAGFARHSWLLESLPHDIIWLWLTVRHGKSPCLRTVNHLFLWAISHNQAKPMVFGRSKTTSDGPNRTQLLIWMFPSGWYLQDLTPTSKTIWKMGQINKLLLSTSVVNPLGIGQWCYTCWTWKKTVKMTISLWNLMTFYPNFTGVWKIWTLLSPKKHSGKFKTTQTTAYNNKFNLWLQARTSVFDSPTKIWKAPMFLCISVSCNLTLTCLTPGKIQTLAILLWFTSDHMH